MIPAEEVFEQARKYFHDYRPIVEELFEVDLSDIVLKETEGFIQDQLQHDGVPEDDEDARQEIIQNKIEGFGGRYWNLLRSIYVYDLKPWGKKGLARLIAHELAHATHHTLLADERAQKVDQKPAWSIFKEGFAEYLELEAFAQHYNISTMDTFLESERERHRKKYDEYLRNDLHKMYESLDDKTRIEKAPQGLRWLLQLRSKLLKFAYGEHDKYFWAVGHTFFKKAVDEGVPVLDVLRNPPEDIETILDPTDYIARVSQ